MMTGLNWREAMGLNSYDPSESEEWIAPRTEDQILNCVGCGEEFVFTTGEQRFFRDKEYQPPKHCKNCRDARKRQQEHSQ